MAAIVEARPSTGSIRRYRVEDREAIRALCCHGAGVGAPPETFFPDRELWADLMTAYYLEVEPEWTWVGIADGALVGYVLGCTDTRRQRRWQLRRGVARALWRFALRGGLGRRLTWRLVAANVRLGVPRDRGAGPLRRAFPAHLHVAVAAQARHRGLGAALVTTLLDELAAAEIRGVHAAVREDNTMALRFFERLGFTPLVRRRALRHPGEPRVWKVFYGRALRAL